MWASNSCSGRTHARLLVAAVFGAATLLGPAVASASDSYPEVIQEQFDMNCAPQCVLCHDSNEGGFGTVNRPFGVALRSGLDVPAGSEDCLRKALDALESGATGDACSGDLTDGTAPTDSDGDGTSDVEELRASVDPNAAGSDDLCIIKYGCGARIEPKGRTDAWAAVAAVLAAAALGFGVRHRLALRR